MAIWCVILAAGSWGVDKQGVVLLSEKPAGKGIQHVLQGGQLCKPELVAILDSSSAAEVLFE